MRHRKESDPIFPRHVVQSTVAEFGQVDVLHNDAARTTSNFLSRDTIVCDMLLDVWQRTLDVNLGSQVLMCKYVVPEMRKNGCGSIDGGMSAQVGLDTGD